MKNENELELIYSKQIDYNNLVYLFSIKRRKSESVSFILASNKIKYEKVYQLSEESKNNFINLLLQYVNAMDVFLNSIKKIKRK